MKGQKVNPCRPQGLQLLKHFGMRWIKKMHVAVTGRAQAEARGWRKTRKQDVQQWRQPMARQLKRSQHMAAPAKDHKRKKLKDNQLKLERCLESIHVIGRRKYRWRKAAPEFTIEKDERIKILANSRIISLTAYGWASIENCAQQCCRKDDGMQIVSSEEQLAWK